MGRQQPKCQPARPRALLRVAADQPHEDRHEWQRQQHQQRGSHVDRDHEREHGERDQTGEHDLREVAGEVGLEPVDPLDGRGHDLPLRGAVHGPRLRAQAALDEREPELAEHRLRRPATGDLERPGEGAAAREDDREQQDVRRLRGGRGPVECTIDDPREQHGLQQDQKRCAEAGRDVGGEQMPDRRRSTE